jgi:hypothetical protein
VFISTIDACIVTITWSRLFLVIALWVIYPTQDITLLYSRMWCPGVLPSMKLHTLHGSVVPAGVTILLGLCNPPHQGCGELAKPGLLYPLVWIPSCGIVFAGVVKQSRLLRGVCFLLFIIFSLAFGRSKHWMTITPNF